WGVDVAKKMHAEMAEGFDLFRSLISEPDIACEPQDGGQELLHGHRLQASSSPHAREVEVVLHPGPVQTPLLVLREQIQNSGGGAAPGCGQWPWRSRSRLLGPCGCCSSRLDRAGKQCICDP
ncbi:hypothetical protein EON64_18870, partial [archaeon]